MMSRASNGRGTLILDKRFTRRGRRAIGRVQRSTGTNSPKVFRAINAMLDLLYEQEQYAPIEAIRDRRLRAIDVYQLYTANRLHEISDGRTTTDVLLAWDAWQARSENADTKRQRKLARTKLAKLLPPQPTVHDLPDALRRLRDELHDRKPSFNRCLAAAQAFVRDTFGPLHPVYDLVTAVGYAKYRKTRRAAPTLAEAIAVRDALPATPAAIWWTMCLTGMGPKELDGLWDVQGDVVAIHGTKRDGRERIVPRLLDPSRRGMGWKQYRAELEPVGKKVREQLGIQRYDARRVFKHLLEEAGVSRTRIKLYMGHELTDVTDGYGMIEQRQFIALDRPMLLSYLALVEQQVRDARKEGMKSA